MTWPFVNNVLVNINETEPHDKAINPSGGSGDEHLRDRARRSNVVRQDSVHNLPWQVVAARRLNRSPNSVRFLQRSITDKLYISVNATFRKCHEADDFSKESFYFLVCLLVFTLFQFSEKGRDLRLIKHGISPGVDKAQTEAGWQFGPIIDRESAQELLGIEDLLLRFVRFVDHRDINSHGISPDGRSTDNCD
jgi:hypothetical protein